MIYFAYGSNMLEERLRHPSRVPDAIVRAIGQVPGFRVRFHKRGRDGSGKCTLVAADDSAAAWGVLFEVTPDDLITLDRVEGVHTGGYVRQSISVHVPDGRSEAAATYIAQEVFVDNTLIPFDWYRDLVVAGAREHGLPVEYVQELTATPARPDPNLPRAGEMRRLLTTRRSSTPETR